MAELQVDELTKKYMRLREIKAAYDAEHKEKTAKVKEAMQKIEIRLLEFFEQTGQSSAKTAFGTPYVTLRESYSVADRDAYLEWVKEHEAWEMLESRVSKSAVEAYKEEHGDLPPGVNYSAERKVNVRGK